MSLVKVTLPGGEIPVNGKQVSFIAPCDCTNVEGLSIEGEVYTVVDAMGQCVTGIGGAFCSGSVVSVILNVDEKKAFIQNPAAMLNALIQKNPGVPIPVGTSLEDATWEQIEAVANAGYAPTFWKLGDTKTIDIDGVSHEIRIIGFAHDNLTAPTGSATKAAITFQLAGLYRNGSTKYSPFGQNVNTGGWAECSFRRNTIPILLTLLPADLQAKVKTVNKLSSAGAHSATINTTADNLFLLSEIEAYNTITYSKAGEGSQYEYFANGGVHPAPLVNGAALRSVYSADSYTIATKDGKSGYTAGQTQSAISFAFCVGESEATKDLGGIPITDILGNPISIPGEQILGGTKVVAGSYVGTGTYGQSKPCSLTFDFEPKFLLIDERLSERSTAGNSLFWVSNNTVGRSLTYGYPTHDIAVNLSGTTIEWYAGNLDNQMNKGNTTYHYMAIG